MKSERNATQLDSRPRWEVIRPESVKLWRYHLCIEAENKNGQIGIELEKYMDSYGECQRLIEFADGSQYWYYPIWLVRMKGEGILC